MDMKKKVVLAFSGGLDTSFCAMYLSKEKNCEVYTALANTGGFSQDECRAIEERAYALGAVKHVTLNIEQEYYEKSIRYMVFGNVLRNGTYPISVSSERIFQAMAIIRYAGEIGADAVAHGSTGAGNDQVRFDLTFDVLAPNIEIMTPTRDMNLSREYEINYLRTNGCDADFVRMEYSINKGLWGTSVGGKETLSSGLTLPERAYPSQLQENGEETLSIDFERGEICGVNGVAFTGKPDAIRRVEAIGSRWAIGRDMHVGDTIIGIKGRVGFEAAGALLIINAHKLLEKHTLTKWQLYWKEQIGTWYGMFLHEAQYLEPVMRDMEAFLESTQQRVTGRSLMTLRPYGFALVGVESRYDLMKSEFGVYGEEQKAWTADDVKGFTRILGNQMKIYHTMEK
ncbi:MAG: argininosuccinate synthase [Tannerella sp.]|jgi:argininosuccinate synthase|nr:argininosuccinate synthase [Tannerella sp.]